MAQGTGQQLWQQGDAAFARRHPLPGDVRKAVWALLACRTARWGGHLQAWPEGPVERVWSHACRHRRGPQGAWRQVERWRVRPKARRLAGDHSPVICTLPDELRGLWRAHVTAMPPRLCAPGREPWCALRRDEPYRGAAAGIIAALHTWRQTLVCHPHLHCLVTGGGLTDAGPWRAVRHGVLRPVRVVMAVGRGPLLAALRQGVAHGQRTPPEGRSRQPRAHRLNTLGRTTWNVHLRERYPQGTGVLTDLAR